MSRCFLRWAIWLWPWLLGLAACAGPARAPKNEILQRAETLQKAAIQAFVAGQYPQAQRDLEVAADLWIRIDMPLALAETRYLQAQTQLAVGHPGAARQALEALEHSYPADPSADRATVADARFDPRREAALLRCQIAIRDGQLDAADGYCRQADADCRGGCASAAAIATSEARLALARSQYAAARAHARRALERAASPLERANATRTRGEIELAAGQPVLALQPLGEALTVDRELGASYRIALDLGLLAEAAQRSGNRSRADDYVRRGLAIAQAIGDAALIARFSRLGGQP